MSHGNYTIPHAQITLPGNQIALIDLADWEWASLYPWRIIPTGKDGNPYVGFKTRRSTRTFYLHRMVMQDPKGMLVDHEDGDGLNNRSENLRVCTPSQNQQNRHGLASNNTSGYRGVSALPGDRWRSQIRHDGKSIYLGSFLTKEDAASAWNVAASDLFGEFATLNLIVDPA